MDHEVRGRRSLGIVYSDLKVREVWDKIPWMNRGEDQHWGNYPSTQRSEVEPIEMINLQSEHKSDFCYCYDIAIID